MEKKYLAVDVGGTSIKVGLFDGDGVLLGKRQLPKTERRMPELVDTICSLYSEASEAIHGIGVSANMVVNQDSGEVYGGSVYIMDGDSYPLRDAIYQRCRVPVAVIKDSNAALLAELRSGCLRGVKSAIALILGTGIGMGIYLDGQIRYGDNSFAGEASTMMIAEANPAPGMESAWYNFNGV